jgi:hypothetical protein
MAHAFNPSTWEAEAGGSLWVPGQPGMNGYTEKPCLKQTNKQIVLKSKQKSIVIIWSKSFCVALGKKLFGEGYSGLEYDYRGLIKLYNSIGNYEKVFEYHNVLSNWNRLRDRQYSVTDALEDVSSSPQSTEEVVQSFLMAQNVEGPSCWGTASANNYLSQIPGNSYCEIKPCCF